MSTCASCSAELRPEWKFCIYCGTPTIPSAIRPDPVEAKRFNPLAILAIVLAGIGGAPALVLGHIAIAQIRRSGERGIVIAWIATVMGYAWLVVWILALTSAIVNAGR